jgi:hypothetical protein
MISVMLTLSLVVGLSSVAAPAKKAQADENYPLEQEDITVEAGSMASFCATYRFDYTELSGVSIANSATIEVVSGKENVLVIPDTEFVAVQGTVVGLKEGVAQIKITTDYVQYTRNSEDEDYKVEKTLATVSTTFNVTVTARSSVTKSELAIKNKTGKVKAGSTYKESYNSVYNEAGSSYAKPVVSYKVISGGNRVKVTTNKKKDGLKIKGISAGEAKIKRIVTWQIYNHEYANDLSSKWKLANKKYYTSTSILKVKVTK